jgi:hypothetical protein
MHYEINIHNAGREPKRFTIRRNGGPRVPVEFETLADVEEAIGIISELRLDTAYEGCSIIAVESLS